MMLATLCWVQYHPIRHDCLWWGVGWVGVIVVRFVYKFCCCLDCASVGRSVGRDREIRACEAAQWPSVSDKTDPTEKPSIIL